MSEGGRIRAGAFWDADDFDLGVGWGRGRKWMHLRFIKGLIELGDWLDVEILSEREEFRMTSWFLL